MGGCRITGTVESFVERISSRTVVSPITPKVAALATQFSEDYSQDPCDRLIGATALAEGMALVHRRTRISGSASRFRLIW